MSLQCQFVDVLVEPSDVLKNGLQLLRKVHVGELLHVEQFVVVVDLEGQSQHPSVEGSDEGVRVDLDAHCRTVLHL